jgi:hypothetical protein
VSGLEDAGLRVVEVDDLDALADDPPGTPEGRPHAIRLRAMRDGWPALGGDPRVAVRPTWVHWACPAPGGPADVLARQSRQQRKQSRRALRLLDTFRMQLCEPVDADLLGQWAQLYAARLRVMPRARNFLALARRDLLATPHALALWWSGDRLVSGCVIQVKPEQRAVVLRFSAVAPDHWDDNLSRAMYVHLAELVAERRLRWLTLGSDVNFYGAIAAPGLCAFKLRLGFRAVPADLFGVTSCRTVTDRVTSLRGLQPPVMRFAYRRRRDPGVGVDDFIDGLHALDLVSVSADEHSAVLESVGPHRRLLLAG